MKLSIIWMLSGQPEKNKKTLENLLREAAQGMEEVQLLVYGDRALLPEQAAGLPKQIRMEYREGVPGDLPAHAYADAISRVKMPYVTAVNGGDTFRAGSFARLDAAVKKYGAQNKIFMMNKLTPEGKNIPFSYRPDADEFFLISLFDRVGCYPYFFGGTVLSASLWKQIGVCETSGIEAEREMMLLACAKEMSLIHISSACYQSGGAREGDDVFFEDVYDPDWYGRSLNEFWPAFLDRFEGKKGPIPLFIQNHVMFTVANRINANLNNKNKHVIPEGQEEDCLRAIGNLLKRLDDRAVFNVRKLAPTAEPDSVKWVYGILKYGEGYRFDLCFYNNILYYGPGSILLGQVNNLKTNIIFMDYRREHLEIDGTVHPILFSMAEEVFFQYGTQKIPLEYNERYGLTKVFGVSIFKSHAFHVSIPMKNPKGEALNCFAVINGEKVKIKFNYESHFSRMSGEFRHSYWCFGEKRQFMAIKVKEGLVFHQVSRRRKFLRELQLQLDMLRAKEKRTWLFVVIRNAYFLARPFMKRHPIWMYLDKIYKGGDSSEYLYKYACAQKDNIRHYYLVDKKSADCARLKKEGYRPLVRGSIRHRLVFLLSDMMVISNSTVFAFNNYGLPNSSCIRDLVDFHVCCVQHGMSVQKIAVAQNRLRDNTRLYFCASRYEFKNLSHPVYDYMGYHALKLTGVPRYDGLVDRHQKQIMISPTWRMQAAVPVRTNEGEQRDYNPLFKESTYYRVFNSLINDPRLLDAAKKYGYRIKYVLHPIVSAQVNDFDRNDYVDIVPAVGDMSYEQMFCESALMVTDFSGIQFDFAYMRKPLVYLHHRDIPQHYEEGSFFYDTMAFGEICHDNDELIDVLCEYMENGCQMKEEYVRRADDFFYYNDQKNCERIYREMIRYQEENIFHKPVAEESALCAQEDLTFDPAERAAGKEALQKAAGADALPSEAKTISDFYYEYPINEKRVVLLGLGKNVRGNMQYILNELNASPRFEGFEIYVRTDRETEPVVKERIAALGWSRTKTVTDNVCYREVTETAKYLITEVFFPEEWVKRPGQVYINIWHGTPLKKLGLAKNYRARHRDGNTQRNFIEADYLLYPNDYTREHMLESYKVKNLMHGKTLMLGYPRTGGMLAASKEDLTGLKAQLAPQGERIYAYMPTWKDYLEVSEVVAEAAELLSFLDENLGDDRILYVNLHHKVSDSLDYSSYRRIKKFPADVDTYRLLAASDALITDYSSVFYDYLVLRKQIILYCADYRKYKQVRGTYMDLDELPFDKALTKEEVLLALNRGKTYDDSGAFARFCNYDSTENASVLCSVLLDETRAADRISPIEHAKGRRVLIYDENCSCSRDVAMLDEFLTKHALDGDDYYVGCDNDLSDENKQTAYPMLFHTSVIGTCRPRPFGNVCKCALGLYEQGRMGFDELMGFLKYDYRLNVYRWFGRARFDVEVIYDVADADRLLTLLTVPAQRLLFISGAAVAKLESGDEFFRKALVYAIDHCMGVFAASERSKIMAELMLPAGVSITLVENADALCRLLEDLKKYSSQTSEKRENRNE